MTCLAGVPEEGSLILMCVLRATYKLPVDTAQGSGCSSRVKRKFEFVAKQGSSLVVQLNKIVC